MRRYTALKNFIDVLQDNDIAIFSGQEMCKEAYQYDRPGNFYIEDAHGTAAAFALGIAMCTNKRIFVCVGEGDLLREFAVLSQISASGCKNIYLVILDNGIYQSAGNLPNIMDSLKSKRGVMYYLGLAVFDYTVYLNKKEFKKMAAFTESLMGPVVLFMDVTPGIKKGLPDVDIAKEDLKHRLIEFIANKDLGTSLPSVKLPALNVNDVNPEVLNNGV